MHSDASKLQRKTDPNPAPEAFRFAGKRLSTTNLAETVSGIIPLDAVAAVLHAGSALADCRSLLPISSA